MLTKLKKSQNQGFTIIEVMIVLAIAALILLIVFLALPALQRSQRNTSRKSDAGHLISAINDFISNNNGALPTTTANCTTVYTDAGNLSQYTGLTCASGGGPAAAGNFYIYNAAAIVVGPNVKANTAIMVPGAVCNGGTSATTVGATTRNAVILYTIEPGGGGNWTWVCEPVA